MAIVSKHYCMPNMVNVGRHNYKLLDYTAIAGRITGGREGLKNAKIDYVRVEWSRTRMYILLYILPHRRNIGGQ